MSHLSNFIFFDVNNLLDSANCVKAEIQIQIQIKFTIHYKHKYAIHMQSMTKDELNLSDPPFAHIEIIFVEFSIPVPAGIASVVLDMLNTNLDSLVLLLLL